VARAPDLFCQWIGRPLGNLGKIRSLTAPPALKAAVSPLTNFGDWRLSRLVAVVPRVWEPASVVLGW
jgi:hypothetical protein